jgi:pyridoxamine 5'-phosphate oxidase
VSTEEAILRDPLEWVGELLRQAADAETDPNIDPMRVALATADADGQPSLRFVLLKDFGREGFVFYTNYESHKAQQLAANPRAALAFHWWNTGVQIRAQGSVAKLPPAESDGYFAGRSRGSQLGAWASAQSRPLASRQRLAEQLAETRERFEGEDVPRPPHWGGYRLTPDRIEIWINGADRLHDRYAFEKGESGWSGTRLAP